jgi:Family of unknown function (DUF5937)
VLLVLEMDVADLAATRFAISPLCETLKAVRLLARSDPPALNRPWVRWARAQVGQRPLRLPRLWPLIATDLPYSPEFLMPAPPGKSPGFNEELARLCATPDATVRESLQRVFGDGRWPQSAQVLFERPRESFAEIATELAECHGRLIVPHWERIRAVLEADISYHAGLLAGGGARSLFSDLHPGLSWSGGKLLLTDSETPQADQQVTLGPDGVVLMPSVLVWPEWQLKRRTSTQTTLVYPARGTATVWEAGLDGAGLGASGWQLGTCGPLSRCSARRGPGCSARCAPPRRPRCWPGASASRRAPSPSTWRYCAAAAWWTGSVAGGRCSTRPRSLAWPCWARQSPGWQSPGRQSSGRAREGAGLCRVRGHS